MKSKQIVFISKGLRHQPYRRLPALEHATQRIDALTNKSISTREDNLLYAGGSGKVKLMICAALWNPDNVCNLLCLHIDAYNTPLHYLDLLETLV